MLLSVIIPAYDDALGLAVTLAEWVPVVRAVGAEVIVVDDGSRDGTAAVAHAAGVRVVAHAANRGYGAAVKTGLGVARGESVLLVDADGSYPAASFEAMWAARAHDTVIGARTSEPDWLKRGPKAVLFAFAGWVAGARVPDLNTGLRLVRTELLRGWSGALPERFSATTTMTMAALLEGRSVAWVETAYRPRVGRSKFHPIADTWRLMRQILRSREHFGARLTER